MSNVTTIERQVKPIDVARHKLTSMEPQFARVLPSHIPAERFTRVVLTALQNNSDILKCSEQSVWNACMRAAQDGLLPDGRDGAIVAYKGAAQWMPMIGGIRKKVRNSGEITTWEVQCVYAGDEFDYQLGDDPFIKHKPAIKARGEIVACYSIATLKDGSKSREVMSIEEVEGVRAKSQALNGPWKDPVFYPEMVRKTVARRHAKVLPMSSDLDDLIRRDDHLYDLNGPTPESAPARREPRSTLSGALDNLAKLPVQPSQPLPQDGSGDDTPPPADPGADAPSFGDPSPQEETASDLQSLLTEIEELRSNREAFEWAQANIEVINALPKAERAKFDRAFIAKQEGFGKPKKAS